MFNVMVIGGALASLLASPLAAVDEASPTVQPVVSVATVNGSGCPAGTAAVSVSADSRSVTLSYSGYYALQGPGAEATEFRRNCQINLQVQVPQGFTYTIAGADYRGFVYLADGATAIQAANYYFQGSSANTTLRHTFTGPVSAAWHTRDTAADLAPLGYAPCNAQRNVNINTELRVNADGADPDTTNFITMDSTVVYRIAVRSCG